MNMQSDFLHTLVSATSFYSPEAGKLASCAFFILHIVAFKRDEIFRELHESNALNDSYSLSCDFFVFKTFAHHSVLNIISSRSPRND